uniref:Transposase n=1 Tax=Macrostomum lignano TaxID=282301 RepID=A0A1I8I1T8_9PLAT
MAADSRASFAGRLRMETNQAARIKRENNRARLDDRHRYLFDRVADFFDQEPEDVEDAMLETESLDLIDSFFCEGGIQRLIFHYQESRHHRSKSEDIVLRG